MTAPPMAPPGHIPGMVLGLLAHAVTQSVYLFQHCYRGPVCCENRIWYRGRTERLSDHLDADASPLLASVRDPQRARWESTLHSLRIVSVNTTAVRPNATRPSHNKFDIFDVETLDAYEIKPDNTSGIHDGSRELADRMNAFNGTLEPWQRPCRPGTSFPAIMIGGIAELRILVPFVGWFLIRRYQNAPGLLLWHLTPRPDRNLELSDVWRAFRDAKAARRSLEQARTYVEIGTVIAVSVVGAVIAAEAAAAAVAALSGEAALTATVNSTADVLASIAPTAEAAQIARAAELAKLLEERALLQRALGGAGGGGIPPVPPTLPPTIFPPGMPPLSALIPPSISGPMSLLPLAQEGASQAKALLDRVRGILDVGAEALRWVDNLPDHLDNAMQDVFERWDTQLQEAAIWEPDIAYFRQSEIPPARFDLPTGQMPVFQRLSGGVLDDQPGDVPVAEPDTPEYGVAPNRAERQRALDAALDRAAVVGIADEMVAALVWAGNETNPLFNVTATVVQKLLEALAAQPGGLAASLVKFGVSPALNIRRRTDWPAIANALLNGRSATVLEMIAITEFLITVPIEIYEDMTENAEE